MRVARSRNDLLVVRDPFERDIPMAIAANPAVADHPPIRRLMRGRPQ